MTDQVLCKMTDPLLLNLENHVSAVGLDWSSSLASSAHFARSKDLIEYYTNISKYVEYLKKTAKG